MKREARLFTMTVLAALTLGGCSKKRPAATPAPSDHGRPVPEVPMGSGWSEDAEAEEARRRAALRAVLEDRVYFDFDSFQIRDDARATLDAKIPTLRAEPSLRMRIEGHTDEQGSVEYNLALGMRRANAVVEYLSGFDLNPRRFEVVSFGEEQPLAEGSGEGAWSRNRRAEFQLLEGSRAPRR